MTTILPVLDQTQKRGVTNGADRIPPFKLPKYPILPIQSTKGSDLSTAVSQKGNLDSNFQYTELRGVRLGVLHYVVAAGWIRMGWVYNL